MKNKLLFITLFTSSILLSQNTSYPEGIYYNYNELISKEATMTTSIEVIERTTHTIKMNGGNDYELETTDKSFKRNELKKLFFAYSDGEFLYLNCFMLKLQPWYSKVLSSNNYFVFKGALPQDQAKYGLDLKNYGVMFGAIGGGFGGMKLAMLRFPFIMNKETQEIILVNYMNIKDFIKDKPVLLEKYENEPEKKTVDVILSYLVQWDKSM